jgi:hypothetical protein
VFALLSSVENRGFCMLHMVVVTFGTYAFCIKKAEAIARTPDLPLFINYLLDS